MATAMVSVSDMRDSIIETFGSSCDDEDFRELCRKVFSASDDEIREAYMKFC